MWYRRKLVGWIFNIVQRKKRRKKKEIIKHLWIRRFIKAERAEARVSGKENASVEKNFYRGNGSWNSINEPLLHWINVLSCRSIALIIRLDQHSSSLLPRSRNRMMEHARACIRMRNGSSPRATYALSKRRNRAAVNEATIWWIEPRNAEGALLDSRVSLLREKKRKKKLTSPLFFFRITRGTRSIERNRSKELFVSPECDLDRSLRLFSFLFSMFKNTRTINRAVISGVEWIHNARTVFSNSVYLFLIRREQRPEFSKSNNVSLSLSLGQKPSPLHLEKYYSGHGIGLVRSSIVRRRFIIWYLKFFSGIMGFLKTLITHSVSVCDYALAREFSLVKMRFLIAAIYRRKFCTSKVFPHLSYP